MKKIHKILTLCLALVLMLGIMAMPASADYEREYIVWTEDELKDLSIPRPDTDGRYVELYLIPTNKNSDELYNFIYANNWENRPTYTGSAFVYIMDKDYNPSKFADEVLSAAREAYDRNTDATWKKAIAETFGLNVGSSGNTTTKPETPVPTTPVTPVTPPVTTPTPTTTPTTGKVTSFSDVKQGAWYYEAVTALANSGIIAGYADGTFRPNQTITAGELATIMCRMFGLDTSEIVTFPEGTSIGTSINRDRNHAGHDDTTVNAGHWAEGAMQQMQAWRTTGDWGMCIANMEVNRGWAIGRLAYEISSATWPDGTKLPYIKSDERDAILANIPDVAPGPGYRWDSTYNKPGEDASHYAYYRLISITEEFHCTTGEEVIANNYIAGVSPQNHAGTDLAAWNAGSIATAYGIGLVNGVDSTGRCDPWAPVTRAQIVQMLYNMGITQAGQLTRMTGSGGGLIIGFGR